MDNNNSVPRLADDALRENFIEALIEHGGNMAKTCRALGLNRSAVYSFRRNNPEFLDTVLAIQSHSRRVRAADRLIRIEEHADSLIDHGWRHATDEHGDLALDEEFEAVRLTELSPKAIVDLMKESRISADGESPLVALQVNDNGVEARTTFVAGAPIDVDALMREHGHETDVEEAEFDIVEDGA